MSVTNFRLFSSSGFALVFPICDTHVTQFLHVPDRPCLLTTDLWLSSINNYKNSNYKKTKKESTKIRNIFFVKFQAPFSQKIINI